MTRHEQILRGVVLGTLGNAISAEAVDLLFELNLVDIRACEQRAMHADVGRLCREGMPRCEAMHVTAEKFSCSYEKVRTAFYTMNRS